MEKIKFNKPVLVGDVLSKDFNGHNLYIIGEDLQVKELFTVNEDFLKKGDVLKLLSFKIIEPFVSRDREYIIERI